MNESEEFKLLQESEDDIKTGRIFSHQQVKEIVASWHSKNKPH